jgi:hypothetical protein
MIRAYKKGKTSSGDPALITLFVDKNAQHNMMRVKSNRDMMMAKHRCERCYVYHIENLRTGASCLEAESFNVPEGKTSVTYRRGESVRAERYDPDENKICSDGIHFFLSMDRAITYKTPFYNHLFRVWFDNGLPRYIGQVDKLNRFQGVFVEYDREGRIIQEINLNKDVPTKAVQYRWKPLIIQRSPPKTIKKMIREVVHIYPRTTLEDLVPGVNPFLSPVES